MLGGLTGGKGTVVYRGWFRANLSVEFLRVIRSGKPMIKRLRGPAADHFPFRAIFTIGSDRMGSILPLLRYGIVTDLARGPHTARLKPMARYGTAKLYAMMDRLLTR